MIGSSFIVLGGAGLIGSAVCSYLRNNDKQVLSITSENYADCIGAKADVLINCNGNSFRYKAVQDPQWDFNKSVLTVQRSLFDFFVNQYVYISTVDVYNYLHDPSKNEEKSIICPAKLSAYAFHKWLAERLVEKYAKRSIILRVGTVLGKGLKKGPIFDLKSSKPLHMSLDSELSFIDTSNIAKAIFAVVAKCPKLAIYNLTGTGSARLSDLQTRVPSPILIEANAVDKTYMYNINTTKIRSVVSIPTSLKIAINFLDNE